LERKGHRPEGHLSAASIYTIGCVNEPILRYSDRAKLARDGSLGEMRDAQVPEGMRNAVLNIIQHLPSHSEHSLRKEVVQHFGLSTEPRPWSDWIRRRLPHVEDFLDLIELLIGESLREYTHGHGRPVPDIIDRINKLCYRHRFAYQVDDRGQVRRVGSPALDEFVVGPALQAVHKPGWEEAERSFREALQHQRGGPTERDDALTAATAALESALKAAGLSGDRLSALAKSLRNSNLVPGELEGVPDALDSLLKRSGAIRDSKSDAHGKDADAEKVPQELVDLSIYWTGAFINYLSAVTE
jgi:hypothetical protein